MADIDRNALAALIEAVEKGVVTRLSIEEMGINILPKMVDGVNAGAAYHGSLNAAKALHEALLPGWTRDVDATAPECGITVTLHKPYSPHSYPDEEKTVSADLSSEARAWLLAILRALAAEGGRLSEVPHDLAKMPRELWEPIVNANSGSLDAAKALHEALLPGWVPVYDGRSDYFQVMDAAGNLHEHKDEKNPARAWLIAILRALAAEGGE